MLYPTGPRGAYLGAKLGFHVGLASADKLSWDKISIQGPRGAYLGAKLGSMLVCFGGKAGSSAFEDFVLQFKFFDIFVDKFAFTFCFLSLR